MRILTGFTRQSVVCLDYAGVDATSAAVASLLFHPSERLLIEQIDYNLLFRWFVGPRMDDAIRNHAVFSKNLDRRLNTDVARTSFAEVNRQAKKFMSG